MSVHILGNRSPKIDWTKKQVFTKEEILRAAISKLMKSCMYACVLAMDKDNPMNPDKGIPTNLIWTEFFP